jgi:uncharacterized membrane protein YccC
MIVILGLILLVAAIVVGVAAVVTNVGGAHELGQAFTVFGYHVTGSTGMLFLFGVIVGGVGVLGLSLLLGGMRRTVRREHTARHSLTQERREDAAAQQGDRTATSHGHRRRLFGHRAAPR